LGVFLPSVFFHFIEFSLKGAPRLVALTQIKTLMVLSIAETLKNDLHFKNIQSGTDYIFVGIVVICS
jgi:hypothetical protein